jgi:hypothetical protein
MKDVEMNYDSICYHLLHGIKNLSEGADCINFANFDGKNEEHLFVLSLTSACIGILNNRNVAIDGPMGLRRRLAADYKKGLKIIKNKGDGKQIDTNELLEGLRGYACSLCGEDFRFGDIYRAYYCGKDK